MAIYKVPQDVEAEDKLIGPFGFRQFIYLLIAAFGCFVAYVLAQIFIGLVLIPLPIILFFIGIALPLRKDQPTEVYLAAILQYRLKSKRRMWKPDGIISTVEILAARKIEDHRTKDISEDQAMTQFEQLAQIMDTHGWGSRGVENPDVNSMNMKLSDAVVQEANNTEDILDSDSSGAQSFDTLLSEQKKISLQEVKQKMQQASTDLADEAIIHSDVPVTVVAAPPRPEETLITPQPVVDAVPEPTALQPAVDWPPQPQAESEADKALLSQAKPDRYPVAIHQQVIQPLSAQVQLTSPPEPPLPKTLPPETFTAIPETLPPQSTSSEPPLAAIIEPVDDTDYTIATIAAEARRRSEQSSGEVVVNLH